jgi:hypothetical protein
VTQLWAGWPKNRRLIPGSCKRYFSFKAFRPALGPTQIRTCVLDAMGQKASFSGVKRSGRETDYSSPSNAQFPHTSSWCAQRCEVVLESRAKFHHHRYIISQHQDAVKPCDLHTRTATSRLDVLHLRAERESVAWHPFVCSRFQKILILHKRFRADLMS